jgi:hypothetical protein
MHAPSPVSRRRSGALPLTAFTLVAVALTASCEQPTAPEVRTAPVAGPQASALAVPLPPGFTPGCTSGTQPGGALYQVCFPPSWNGSVIVYAHGYVPDFEPLAIPEEAPGLAAFAAGLGFGFASTSYRINGLAIPEGVADVHELAGILRTTYGVPGLLLLAGASEGGAVATLAAEAPGGAFQGALSTCGPTGSFQRQIDYFGDFHVLFNYFFPGVNVGNPTGVPAAVVAAWDLPGGVRDQALAAIVSNPAAAQQLLAVSRAAVDPGDPTTAANTILGILRYDVLATNQALVKLGGQPFDNRATWYWGSSNDFRLNRLVRRVTADAAARHAVASSYETSGRLTMPYVSVHTTLDEIVPFDQQVRYRLKALFNGSATEHSAFPVVRYGHCNFEQSELTLGLGLLAVKVGAATAPTVAASLAGPARGAFREGLREMRPGG